ncbi:MAG TPA: ABC transporter permease [Methanofastidiosum sp.]|nr:ABC transporter permease [Methanofastidiosum sp.]HRS25930.1 ABC transporter permease [Methanofastidiosum sp.]
MIEKMIKWELRRLFKNKKFKIAFILQLLVILLIIPLFGSYVRALEEGGFFNLSIGGKGYLPIGIYSEENSLTDIISENKRIEILWLDEKKGFELLESGRISAFLEIERNFEDNLRSYKSSTVKIYINSENPKSIPAYSELNSIILGFRDGAIEARISNLSIVKPEVELVYRSPFANNEIPDNENSHGIIQEQAQVNTTNILNNPSNFEEQIKKNKEVI